VRKAHESQRSRQHSTSHRRNCRRRLVVLRRASDSAEHQRRPLRHRSDCARAFCELVPSGRRGRRTCSNRGQRIAGLPIAFRTGANPFIAAFMSFLSYSQNAFLKWRQGLLAPSLWLGREQVMMNLFGAPGGKAFWRDRGYIGEDFRRYVEDELMKRQPHPDAKPLGAFGIGGESLPTNPKE
jgi:hypothetical protein